SRCRTRLWREAAIGDRPGARRVPIAAAARRAARRHEPARAVRDGGPAAQYPPRPYLDRRRSRHGRDLRARRAHAGGDTAQRSGAGRLSRRNRGRMSALLEVHSLNSYYGDSHILFDVSLRVERNEVVALLGRNGAGKSTTLKSLIGLVRPRSGRIVLDGVETQN